MLVSRLALVEALVAPTTELRAQHKYKILVVQTADLDDVSWSAPAEHCAGRQRAGAGREPEESGAAEESGRHRRIPAGKTGKGVLYRCILLCDTRG